MIHQYFQSYSSILIVELYGLALADVHFFRLQEVTNFSETLPQLSKKKFYQIITRATIFIIMEMINQYKYFQQHNVTLFMCATHHFYRQLVHLSYSVWMS